jgi:hypothetical protein
VLSLPRKRRIKAADGIMASASPGWGHLTRRTTLPDGIDKAGQNRAPHSRPVRSGVDRASRWVSFTAYFCPYARMEPAQVHTVTAPISASIGD